MASAAAAAAGSCRLGGRPYHKSSVDSQFADDDDDTELTVLDACIDCDDEGLYDLIQDGVTWDQVNERDKSGRVRARNLSVHVLSVCLFFCHMDLCGLIQINK